MSVKKVLFQSPWQAEIQHALATGQLISTETAREIMKDRLLQREVQTRRKRIDRFFEEELPVWDALKFRAEVKAFEIEADKEVAHVSADLLACFG